MKHKNWFNWKLQTWRWHYTWSPRCGWEEAGRDALNRPFKYLKTYCLFSREAEESLPVRESRDCHSLPVPWLLLPLNCWVLLFQMCSSGLSSINSWCFPGWEQLWWPANTVLFNCCQHVFQRPHLHQPAQPELPATQSTWGNFPLDFMFSTCPHHTKCQENRQHCPNPFFIHSAREGHRELTADCKAKAALYNSDENLANTSFSKAWILLFHCSLIIDRASWGRGN